MEQELFQRDETWNATGGCSFPPYTNCEYCLCEMEYCNQPPPTTHSGTIATSDSASFAVALNTLLFLVIRARLDRNMQWDGN